MVDCGKTVIFLSEWKRMCSTQPIDPMCGCCPLKVELAQKFNCKQCFAIIRQYPDEAQRIVQRWSDEHPLPKQKTFADDFFEKFPHARGYSFDYDGTKVPSELMRCMLYNIGYSCEFEGSKFCDADRRADCWREPYPEQEEANGA